MQNSSPRDSVNHRQTTSPFWRFQVTSRFKANAVTVSFAKNGTFCCGQRPFFWRPTGMDFEHMFAIPKRACFAHGKKLCRLKIQVWVYWNREAPSATSKSTGNGLNLATICRIYRLVINKIHLRLQNHGGFIDEQSKIVQRIMSTSCCFHSPSASIALDRLESTAPGGRTKDFQIHCPPWALDSQT